MKTYTTPTLVSCNVVRETLNGKDVWNATELSPTVGPMPSVGFHL